MFVTSQQKAYSKIRTMILSGQFKAGERIPEIKVAELIGMKRGPVRESLIKLESDGLLVSEPHFGFAVRTYTIDEAKQLYELREVIEGGAAALAAKNATVEDIERLKRAHQAFVEKIERNKDLAKMEDIPAEELSNAPQDEAFHRAILKASRNRRFSDYFNTINDEHMCLTLHYRGKKLRRIFYDKESCDHHQRIMEAIIDHNCEQAEQEARLHIRKAREGIIRYLEEFGEDVYLA